MARKSYGPVGKPRKKMKKLMGGGYNKEVKNRNAKSNPTKGGKIAGNWYKPKRIRSVKQ